MFSIQQLDLNLSQQMPAKILILNRSKTIVFMSKMVFE